MTRQRVSRGFRAALLGSASLAAWLGGCRTSGEAPDAPSYDVMAPPDAAVAEDAQAASADGGVAGAAAGTGCSGSLSAGPAEGPRPALGS